MIWRLEVLQVLLGAAQDCFELVEVEHGVADPVVCALDASRLDLLRLDLLCLLVGHDRRRQVALGLDQLHLGGLHELSDKCRFLVLELLFEGLAELSV